MQNTESAAPGDNGLPFFSEEVAAGFPSPAAGDIKGILDLNELCIQHPAATYFIRARGESMIDAGISDGDVLVVDRSLNPRHGDIIIAELEGSFTVKYYEKNGDCIRLVPANSRFSPIIISHAHQAAFFGVVTWVLKSLR
ncbi:MAG: translesion error-prone DNA polymerase V autoproteolytic subunit [Akkermansia sp.]|nr:translesion error-prone DNA polymerase V autoproteolytic subunit [Akkermansia sp.]